VGAAFEYTEDVAELFGAAGELAGFAFAIFCAFGVPALLGAILWRRWRPPSLKPIFLGGLLGAFSLCAFLILRLFLILGYVDWFVGLVLLGGLVVSLIVAGMMVSGAANARRRASSEPESALPEAEARERD
jgi:hypothetical protein